MNREDWNARWADAEEDGHEHGHHAGPDPILEQETAHLTPGRALDLGCGDGTNALWLAVHGWRVTGVDFAANAVALGRRAASRQGLLAEFVEGDLLEYEPSGPYDLVTLFYVHLPPEELADVLGRAAGALADGGTLLVVGHDVSNRPLEEGEHGPKHRTSAAAITAALPGLTVEKAAVQDQGEDAHSPQHRYTTVVRARR